MITVISGKNKAMNFCDGICKDGTLCRYKSKITDTIGKHFCGIHVLQGVFQDCCICMDAICEQPVTVTNCKHIFHTKCLEKWTTNYNTNCPLCRAQIYKQNVVTSPWEIYSTLQSEINTRIIEIAAIRRSLWQEFRNITISVNVWRREKKC